MRNFIRLIVILFCLGMNSTELKAQTNPPFSINGQVTGLQENTMLILSYVANDVSIADTTQVKDGKFHFDGQLKASPVKGWIRTRDNTTLIPIYLEGSEMTVKGKIDTYWDITLGGKIEQFDSITITGSKTHDEYEIFQKMGTEFKSKKGALNKQWRDAARAKDKRWEAEMEKISDEVMIPAQVAWHSKFVLGYPDSYLSGSMELWDMMQSYAPDTLMKKMWDGLSARNKTTPVGVELGEFVKARLSTAIGKQAPEFTQNDVNGQPFKLSSLRGKYVLIDFWAAWCGPCRAENPNLLKTYNKYKNDGFTVLGVSLDRNADEWKKAIEKDGLPWNHVSDLKFWKNAVAVQYAVPHVPFNHLVDPKGKIIAISLRGEKLDEKLAQIFGH